MPGDSIYCQLPVECGDHLVMRHAKPEDAEALVKLNTSVFDDRITHWTADLVSGMHPTVQPADFTVVEDTRYGRIVSSVCLISQTWQYDGIPFRVGRPDLVATDPEYRRRGLVRRQFEAIHARSAAKGELMQVIAGVDWFYRQFGYEMAAGMWGSRIVDAIHLPVLKDGESECCRLRQAAIGDLDFIREIHGEAVGGQLFAALRTDVEWKYEMSGRSRENTRRREWLIVEDLNGNRIGYVQYLPCLAVPRIPLFRIYQVELKKGVGYLNLMPGLLRALWEKGMSMVRSGELPCVELKGLELALERNHPLYHVIPMDSLREIKPSPWYIRISDIAGFLRWMRPALEKHLIGTPAEGYSGDLKLNFYRSGIRMIFDRGLILSIDGWKPTEVWEGDARFPDSSFLHLACGWRRFVEMACCYPDCWGTHEASILLDSLFPSFHGKAWLLA